ncbi:MAG: hypothetical protein BWX74_00869 [Tenericutes bacterium ADurb.Bin087]|nr:MAG: hypothetical protein BWX74_00869 [Tenericutes bacterium ADurb.Bin087]
MFFYITFAHVYFLVTSVLWYNADVVRKRKEPHAMEKLVFETIESLLQIKKLRIEERGPVLSRLTDDEIVLLIDNLVDALQSEYLVQ